MTENGLLSVKTYQFLRVKKINKNFVEYISTKIYKPRYTPNILIGHIIAFHTAFVGAWLYMPQNNVWQTNE